MVRNMEEIKNKAILYCLSEFGLTEEGYNRIKAGAPTDNASDLLDECMFEEYSYHSVAEILDEIDSIANCYVYFYKIAIGEEAWCEP